jgi:hypothetical protein
MGPDRAAPRRAAPRAGGAAARRLSARAWRRLALATLGGPPARGAAVHAAPIAGAGLALGSTGGGGGGSGVGGPWDRGLGAGAKRALLAAPAPGRGGAAARAARSEGETRAADGSGARGARGARALGAAGAQGSADGDAGSGSDASGHGPAPTLTSPRGGPGGGARQGELGGGVWLLAAVVVLLAGQVRSPEAGPWRPEAEPLCAVTVVAPSPPRLLIADGVPPCARAQGLAASRVLRHFSALVKACSAAAEIVVTAAAAHVALGTAISRTFPLAAGCVGAALVLYASVPPNAAPDCAAGGELAPLPARDLESRGGAARDRNV